ncbi:elongation factor G [Promineifilum sp.]|uniref:elongation factor G n=1 Tax=Promineifilum sp. TaxID=2664178 RepID=UPI0035B3DA3F
MKDYQTGQIRNIALISHNGAGKTTLVERLLFKTGAITRMGSVLSGTAHLDFEEEEIARNSSIATAIAPIEWKGVKLNLLDAPGFLDFIGEVNSAMKVADSAMVLIEAVAGVEVGTEAVWAAADHYHRPRLIVVNKMDRENVRTRRVLESIRTNLHGHFVELQLPIGEGPGFKGVVDLLSMEARLGEKGDRAPIPADLAGAAEEGRTALVEAAAEGEDALIEKYLEGEELTAEEIARGLKGAILKGAAIPILYCAGEVGIGTDALLDACVTLLPAPNEVGPFEGVNAKGEAVKHEVSDASPLAVFVWKSREDNFGKTSYLRVFGGTLESDSRVWDADHDAEVRVGQLQAPSGKETQPVPRLHAGDIGTVVKLGEAATNGTLGDRGRIVRIAPIDQPDPLSSVSIHPVSQSDTAKLSQSLNRLVAEDPTLHWHTEPATRETILSGMGVAHLDIAVHKAQSKFGVHLRTTTPKVPYRETITKSADADYTHKKQTGGAGQYARVVLRVEPVEEERGFEFASEVFGGAVSAPFVSATEKGCRQALENGVLAGYPVVGIRTVITDGKMHPVDSKEIAFQTAGREGFKQAVMKAGPMLLEPIYEVTVTVPADNMGDILGDMNSRRARVLGMDQDGNKSIVRAEVPLAEMQSYAADLRSMTQGRGLFSMKFMQYGRVPGHLQEELVVKLRKEREAEEAAHE